MKNYFFFLLCMLFCVPLYAQRERNYIYLFDCTQSMKTVVDIWEPTKKYLREDIERLSPSSTVAIIPFQGNTHPTIQFECKDFNWNKIEEKFDRYIEDKTNTNICSAWDKGVEYIDVNKDNYFYILTDGEDTVKGIGALCQRIREWCGQYKNSYAFYVMLTENAKENEKELSEAIGTCSTIRLIDPKGHISPFGIFEEVTLTTNTLELEKQIKLPFSTVGKYDAAVNCKDSLFGVSLVDNTISDGKAIFKIDARKSKQEIAAILNGKDRYDFDIEVKAKGVDILNSNLTVNVVNKPERVLTMIDEEETNIGKSSYYPAFLFWKEKQQDTLRCNLNQSFNQPAIEYASSVRFKVTSSDKTNDYQVLINEMPCPENEFVFDGKTNNSILSIIFDKNAQQGKRYFLINPVQVKETDRINRTPTEQYQLSVRAGYSIDYNPLAIILLGLAIILISLLILWFAAIKIMMYPRIKLGRITITEPYYKSLKIYGARKVIFTSNPQKQSMLNRLFTGRIVYEANEIWTSRMEMEPCKKALRPTARGKYLITPFTTRMEKNTEYEIQNIDTNQQIRIIIN
ncbi:vWA domain-containing protein [Bacteroides ovatus]|uniref:vWA domain-containing protein n=1 Tax=Bacteroides ovatus TaxID=28116 RepID=UPI0031456C4C